MIPFAESQNELILNYLKAGNSLTPIDALNKFGCFRLSGRIHDLKAQGHIINTEIITTKTGKRIAEYKIVNL